jgi:hypothetical protein
MCDCRTTPGHDSADSGAEERLNHEDTKDFTKKNRHDFSSCLLRVFVVESFLWAVPTA